MSDAKRHTVIEEGTDLDGAISSTGGVTFGDCELRVGDRPDERPEDSKPAA